ncbi:zinc finger protein 414 [Rhineura floridana]|uniref:zinc finger protein 414 n=1 Tax=Rhineura floridana TaxID=261503 RepID=UPI002AC83F75|nr:zinc finger protein 414 [Rhineura floridana]
MEKTPSPVHALPAAAALACQDLRASPSRIRSKPEKEEGLQPPLVTSLMASSGGSTDPGPARSQSQPTPTGGSRIRKQDLRLPKRRPPGKRYQCSGDGCRLACRSLKELLDHMPVHYRPTESLEGKIFRCSALGCVELFPTMQDLMGHMKVHYKPNRYFKCENCMSRFQTYRSLFKHLHSCSDAAAAAAAGPSPVLVAEKPTLPPTSGSEKEPPSKLLEDPPKAQSVIQNLKKDAVLPSMTEAAPATDSLPASLHGPLGPMPIPLPASHPYPLLEQSLFGPPSLARFSGPAHPSVPGPFLPYMHPATYTLPQAAVQNRLRPFLPGQGLPVSNAVWKKSQGHSSNSRIVWEHTRGRYNCLQCPYSTASREEVTQHIEDHRKNPSPPTRLEGEMDFGVGLPSFHPKLTPEVENALFSPL